MRVYELMNELSELPAGQEIKVSVCISPAELATLVKHATDDLFYLHLGVGEITEDGFIDTVLT